MAKERATLRLQDVAEEAGVSIATASRSLSGATGVSDSVAAHVRAVAARLGYVANVHARSLAAGTSRSVGLVVHEIGDPYFAEIASGVLRLGAEEGLTVQICHTGRDPRREVEQIRELVAQRVGAIIIAGSGFVDPAQQWDAKTALQAYQAAGGRVAVIGRHHLGADAVLPENTKGGRAVADHLIGLGHRRIAVITGSLGLTTVADRMVGVREAHEAAGLAFDHLPVLEAPFTRDGGKQATARLLEEGHDVTAVLALNDDMAIGALSVLRSRGIAVPEQISVSGFDDVAVAGDLAPSLTTVRLPMADMGEQALGLALLDRGSRPRRRTAGHELVIRDSTGVPGA
ncbi:LacI family transcriptional regulator [Nocardioides panacisoli]|uniref:LacI family DNA-binding transcriptional regulator n=1 Tax=Nocardioides panacisoli TaxID=627624 RepID=UPI001C6254E1|nr:LacI family DNA-binding transcriptional regulator [Nocardioides panacisoli]QYJ02754.1 LacI family transcriptional regulator [Nocardioides panacisoli]